MNETDKTPDAPLLAALIAEKFQKSKEQLEKFQTIAEICPVPVWICDSEGQLAFVNSAYTKLTGFTAGEIMKTAGEISNNLDHTRIYENTNVVHSWHTYVKDENAEQHRWNNQCKIITKDSKIINCTITAIKIKNNGFVGFLYPDEKTEWTLNNLTQNLV